MLEQDGSPEAAEVLLALDRLIASPWARAAAPAAERLVAAGVAPATTPVELQVLRGFAIDLGTFALLAMEIEAGAARFQGTLIAQRTGAGSDHLDGGLASALDAEQADVRYTALRGSFEDAIDLGDGRDARKEAARLFAWARELPAPSTQGLELERPLLALALTGRRDPWPRLEAVPEAESRRMREAAAGGGAPPPRSQGLAASLERSAGAERAGAKAARAARRRNRR